MATIKIIEEDESGHPKKREVKTSRRDKSHKTDKKRKKEDLNDFPSAGQVDDLEGEIPVDIQRWSDVESDAASDAASMMSLTMDEAERNRLLIEEEESSVSTVEDGPTVKGTSYYIQHQRFIESSVLTPLEEVCDASTSPLSPVIIENLKKMGMQTLFPVQAEVIPFILRGVVWGGDVCVCAPTGSGKTLAYVIPIVQALQTRVVQRLRALVLVPTHDLVVQVSNVFLRMVEGTDLVVEALYGNKGFAGEQARLVPQNAGAHATLAGGASAVDIVVSTPGRLVDHLQETPGFTLQHLQFLVLDEADRLLMHSFQDWLPKVLEAVHAHREGRMEASVESNHHEMNSLGTIDRALHAKLNSLVDSVTNRAAFLNVAIMERQYTHLQKLLFSATLTQNPEKVDSLRLVNPQYFTATSAGKSFLYTIPTTLEQNLTVCTEQHKPLLLLYLLTRFKDAQTLCFVASIETAHRLSLLLKFLHAEQFLNGNPIYEYSSSLTQQERNSIIMKFKTGAPGVIICSDVMARGLDIQNVRAVINYDLPFHVKTYVHRVGRTGRAGRAGTSWSIALKEEVRKFKSSLSKAENSTQNYVPLPYEDIKTHFGRYKEALRQLQIEMEREKGAAAIAQSLQHASFSLPLDSTNAGDLKSIQNSLQTQVATAWFPEDVLTLFAPSKPNVPQSIDTSSSVNSEVNQSNPQIKAHTSHHGSEDRNFSKNKNHQEVASATKTSYKSNTNNAKPDKANAKKAETPAKAKRKRRNKKGELDSLSFSSSDSSSDSSSSESEPIKTSKSKIPTSDTKSKDSKSKRRRKHKKGELDSLSLSSDSSDESSSNSSDSEPKEIKKVAKKSDSKENDDGKESKKSSKSKSSDPVPDIVPIEKRANKKRKRGQLDDLSLSSTSSSSSSDSSKKKKKSNEKKKSSSKDKKAEKKRKSSE